MGNSEEKALTCQYPKYGFNSVVWMMVDNKPQSVLIMAIHTKPERAFSVFVRNTSEYAKCTHTYEVCILDNNSLEILGTGDNILIVPEDKIFFSSEDLKISLFGA